MNMSRVWETAPSVEFSTGTTPRFTEDRRDALLRDELSREAKLLHGRPVGESPLRAEESNLQRLLEGQGRGDDLAEDAPDRFRRERTGVGGRQALVDRLLPIRNVKFLALVALCLSDLNDELGPSVEQGEYLVIDAVDLVAEFGQLLGHAGSPFP